MRITVRVPPELRLLTEAVNFDYREKLSRAIKECFGNELHGLDFGREEIESMIDVEVGSINEENSS